jgi:hypothetical protein
MTAARRNLVVSPIGDESVHASWLSHPEARTFDLLLINYGSRPDFGRSEATHYFARQGFKWELVHHALAHCGDILDRYANIWCPDCDIRADTGRVNRLFELFEEYHLQMAQPAIAKGEVTYKSLRQRPGLILRYTPFVECMCPIFTRQALDRVSPTFLENRSGWGLDCVWPRFFQPCEIAILDSVGVEHTGQLLRGANYQQLARLGIDPGQEFEQVIAKYGGFQRRLHRKFVRGTVRLPAIREPLAPVSWMTRLVEAFGLRRQTA